MSLCIHGRLGAKPEAWTGQVMMGTIPLQSLVSSQGHEHSDLASAPPPPELQGWHEKEPAWAQSVEGVMMMMSLITGRVRKSWA